MKRPAGDKSSSVQGPFMLAVGLRKAEPSALVASDQLAQESLWAFMKSIHFCAVTG